MHTITLTQESIRNELKEKLKNLQKFEQSEEFAKIKEFCDKEAKKLEKVIEKEIKDRLNKEEWHKIIYSELDFMIKNKEFLELILKKATDKTFVDEVKENIENVKSHLYLQTGWNYDFCVYSKLDSIKYDYKLFLWIEHNVKQMITRCELQDKEIDVNPTINAYSDTPKSTQIEI